MRAIDSNAANLRTLRGQASPLAVSVSVSMHSDQQLPRKASLSVQQREPAPRACSMI